ncbi:PIR Superfamily Protein [Plasmodium ovale wallikeri]|uniref:PIR Superfamily Protein n=1 Tax=Plasmodium ovale wallikeri TaxID=864142 RepID=A0A1A9AJX5_PLAOA|nr:PIR Superfamily Protein [Plasmodium ovale wallikeri]SBT56380.1 PIR Superfamily Protein [Plasmodium ovale wallikeri]
MNFAEAEKYYNVLNKFQTFKSEFDKYTRDTTTRYYSYLCNEVTKLLSDENKYYENTCLDVLHYLKYMTKFDSQDDKHESCMFLNYYLNNSLHQIKNYKQNATKFYANIKTICSKSFLDMDICEKEIKDIHPFVLYAIQTVFNLYYHFQKYKGSSIPDDVNHCLYAYKFVSIYENSKNTCKVHYNTSFCQKIIDIKDQYNTYRESDYKCSNIEKKLQNPEKKEPRNILQVSGPYGSSLDGHHMLGNTSNHMGNNISVPFAILLVTPILLFILYKFTPLGPMLRPHLHKYLGISGNIDEKNHELHSNNFSDDETETHNSGYNITYNSLAQ